MCHAEVAIGCKNHEVVSHYVSMIVRQTLSFHNFHCQVSDDEDETHPNIDTPSLFRWRHQARVEKMEEAQKERENMNRKLAEYVILVE